MYGESTYMSLNRSMVRNRGKSSKTVIGASMVIHSTLVAERGDKEFSVTGFFILGSIKSIFHQTYNHKHVKTFILPRSGVEAHPQH